MKKQNILIFIVFISTLNLTCWAQIPTLDYIINQYIKANKSGDVLLVTKGDKIIHHKAYCLASKELSVPINTKNVFRIASMTKQFVAVSILTLVEQGKINLDDDIRKYLPNFPDKGQIIKIQHLLSHTSDIINLASKADYSEMIKKEVSLDEIPFKLWLKAEVGILNIFVKNNS